MHDEFPYLFLPKQGSPPYKLLFFYAPFSFPCPLNSILGTSPAVNHFAESSPVLVRTKKGGCKILPYIRCGMTPADGRYAERKMVSNSTNAVLELTFPPPTDNRVIRMRCYPVRKYIQKGKYQKTYKCNQS